MALRRSSSDGRHRATGWSAVAAVVAMAAVLVTAAPAAAGPESAGIEETRRGAEAAAQAYADTEAELGRIETDLATIEATRDEVAAEVDELRDTVQVIMVERYMTGYQSSLLSVTDLNEQTRADALVRIIGRSDADAIDRFRARSAELAHADKDLEAKKREQQHALADLEEERDRLTRELDRLQELERARIEAEQKRQEAARAAAAAAADQNDGSESAAPAAAPDQGPATPGGSTSTPATVAAAGDGGSAGVTPPPAPPSVPPPDGGPGDGGPMLCPVPGSVFVDTWGAPRSDGRVHLGVDMMAPSGTPVQAPVSGTVTHKVVSTGGLSFFLTGTDGRVYFGTHLSAYGQGGAVSAGTVIGYVGATGNATTPHLHFEIHINGQPVNPYPYVKAVC